MPESIARDLFTIRELSTAIFAGYRSLYSMGYSAGARGEAHVQTSTTDPTGELVSSEAKARLRGRALEADEAIANAKAALRAAETAIARALYSPRDPVKPTERFPRSVNRAELRESRQAQRRRHERGDE